MALFLSAGLPLAGRLAAAGLPALGGEGPAALVVLPDSALRFRDFLSWKPSGSAICAAWL